ncbi:MAG TPA: class I SAM-dependent methyltransferase [Candidatus Bathyarchaeia archaeon]|nr:class I SAM-dependent methyltransferase [Candidatus Bathyarchaeia archaeon]
MGYSEKDYWDQAAQEFDSFYSEEKAALKRTIDKIFRKAMTERFHLTLEECKNVKGKQIVDVGCGSGRLAVELAKRGAYVTGIDFSQKMIDMAKTMAEEAGVQGNCTFIRDDYADHVFKQKFDISIALGFFDYTKDPAFFVKKMRSMTTGKCITSFPAKLAFQVPLRMIWLRCRNCPVYFYTKNQLKRLFAPHFSHYKIKNISAVYFCVASV